MVEGNSLEDRLRELVRLGDSCMILGDLCFNSICGVNCGLISLVVLLIRE